MQHTACPGVTLKAILGIWAMFFASPGNHPNLPMSVIEDGTGGWPKVSMPPCATR